MIIRKNKNTKNSKTSPSPSLNAQIAKSDAPRKSKNVIKKEDVILDIKNVENTNSKKEPLEPVKLQVNQATQEETFEKIDISSIEFKERVERRRGDRRRGYRRIDERSLVSRAQQEAHTIKELAAREGYKNGLDKAQKEIEEIKTSLIEFLSLKDSMYEEFYPHILEISLEIAKKIIKKETEIPNDVLKNVIISTLEEINGDVQKITIKVNPKDVEFASASLPEIIEAKDSGVKFSITGDETIEPGSCLLTANNGVIDANFKTQLLILQNAFGIYKGGV